MPYYSQAQCEAILDKLYTHQLAIAENAGVTFVMDALGTQTRIDAKNVDAVIDVWEKRRTSAISASTSTRGRAIVLSRRRPV